MLEDGLERDHIAVNTTKYCVIEHQIDNLNLTYQSRKS